MTITKVYCCPRKVPTASYLNSFQGIKNVDKKITSKYYIPSRKEVLSYKLKFALMNCDPYHDTYKKNQELCKLLWDDVDSLALELKKEKEEVLLVKESLFDDHENN